MKRVMIGFASVSVPAMALGACWKQAIRHHDEAFMQFLWETWESPTRETLRIQECESYLDQGLFLMLLNKAPFDAAHRFRNVTLAEYDAKCLNLARAQLACIVAQVEAKH